MDANRAHELLQLFNKKTENQKKQDLALFRLLLTKIKLDEILFFEWLIQLLNQANLKTSDFIAEEVLSHKLVYALRLFKPTPLKQALLNQDFDLVRQLLNEGAIPTALDRAAFELALDSEKARSYGFQQESLPPDTLHAVKKYGLVLGISMTSEDGTFSQTAQMKPTHELMTETLAAYASKKPEFKAIADAFSFSHLNVCFNYSTPSNRYAASALASRINEGKVTQIPATVSGHALGLSVVPNPNQPGSGYLVYTNRGIGADLNRIGTNIYKIDNLKQIDKQFIDRLIHGHSRGRKPDQLKKALEKVTGNQPPIYTLHQKPQKQDNCTIANPRANLHGVLLCQKAIEKGSFNALNSNDFDSTKATYKAFTHDMRQQFVNELVSELKADPENTDLNRIAKTYLAQHPQAKASLRAPLEATLKQNDFILNYRQERFQNKVETVDTYPTLKPTISCR